MVVEVVGGIEPARSWLVEALRAGKSVVTANKALLAEDGGTLHDAAAEGGADLYYEAAVAGAIPLLRPLRESLHGDRITQVTGIVNGTTNFILSAMDATGAGFTEALEEATALGYAEADPTADIEGFDAAAKAAILASLAFHTRVTAADVYREGITEVTAADVASAKAMGCTIKLLCIASRGTGADGAESVSVRVHPAMIPLTHPLASVGDAFNAVFVEAEAAGQLMFYGRGAGGAPTASAVLGDVVAVARNRLAGVRARQRVDLRRRCRSARWARRSPATTSASTWPTVRVCSPPWPNVFARHDVSIATVRQASAAGDPAGRWRRHPGDRHPRAHRRRAGGHRRGAARAGHRPLRRQRAAGRRRILSRARFVFVGRRRGHGVGRERAEGGVSQGAVKARCEPGRPGGVPTDGSGPVRDDDGAKDRAP